MLAVAMLLAACHQPPTGPQATAVVPDAPPEPPPAPPVACPLVPVALVVTPFGAEPRTVLALDDKGRLDVSMFRHRSGAAKLDTQGCLAGSDGLWAEWAPRDQVWTPHETLAVAGNCIMLPNDRALVRAGIAVPAGPTPMFHANRVGLRQVVRRMREFAANPHADPASWKPAQRR